MYEIGFLVELNELFNLHWRRIIPLGQTGSSFAAKKISENEVVNENRYGISHG